MDNFNKVKKVMPIMLIMYVISTLMDQAFTIISPALSEVFHISPSIIALQVSICTIVFAICGAIYGTISDFIPIKKIILFAVFMFVSGSLLGLIFQSSFKLVILARAIQTVGSSALSALYLVLTARYLKGPLKIKYFALFTACFQLSAAVGVLAGGLIATYVKWWMLFIIPFSMLFFLPALVKYLPKEEKQKSQKIDVFGLFLLAALVLSISMYFSKMQLFWLAICGVAVIIFTFYITKNKKAFVTIDFFKNKNYVTALGMEFLLYSLQIPFPFMYSYIISEVYGKSLATVSYVMLPAYLVAAIVGTLFTDKAVKKFGKSNVLTFAMTLIVLALVGTGFFLESGIVILSITSILFSCGYVLMYSPVVDTVVSTLPESQVGRGLGFNDLLLNVSASIGIAVTGQLMGAKVLSKVSLPNIVDDNARIYAALMIILAMVFSIGVIIFKINQKNFEKIQE